MSTDIMLSSWAKFSQMFALDFNFGLGLPKSVVRPRFFPAEGLVYLLPKKPHGEIVAAIFLRDEDMDKLVTDDLWERSARHLG